MAGYSNNIHEDRNNILDPGFCGRSILTEKQGKSEGLKLTSLASNILRPLYRKLRHIAVITLCSIRKDFQGIILVDPIEIEFTVNRNDKTLKRNNMWHFGSVCDGDWDMNGLPINQYGDIFPILKQRVKFRTDFYDIPQFIDNLHRINQGETPDNCLSERQYLEKWQRIEILYNLLKKFGYKSQSELKTGFPFNEIRVQVGRYGDLLFEEGMHRIVICKLLGIDKIPVLITRRHADWVKKHGSMIYKNHTN